MLRSWKIGRAFGIDIYVHWSFWILPVIFVVTTKSFGLVQAPLAVATVFLAFACVVFHEYGHALTARRFGIGTRDITLYPLGGVASLNRMSEKPVEEILIALAGPAVNVVIVLLLGIGIVVFDRGNLAAHGIPDLAQFSSPRMVVYYLLGWNIIMFLFNLAPAFPMDGGRVLRAFLALFVDRITATKVAVYVGMGVASLFILAGIMGAYWLILIGLFVMLLGPLELAMLQRQDAVRRQAILEALPADVEDEAYFPAPPPEPKFSGYTWDPALRAWVEWREGWPVRQCRMRAW